ncbi:MAG TPA: alpha/beta hydrolase [Polyangiaceae bacterium]|nr:alpha/beta hydrolase [Polyangiaceae bacterium]
MRRKRIAWVVGGIATLALVWFWPARRNYYARLGEVERRLNVPYVAGAADPKRQLDLYLPRNAAAPFPIVVFVHGGYWSPLDRRWLEPLIGTFGNVGVAFARQGVAAAVIGYRQYPAIQHGDDSLDDIASAVRFVHDSCPAWGCGPLFVFGHSAGGHLVSLLALDPRILARHGVEPDSVAGFVSFDGIFDLEASLPAFSAEQAAIMRRLFGPDSAALAAHSTVTYARARHPRLLVMDTTGDAAVCRDAFRQLKKRCGELGSPARFVELVGLGHNDAVVRMGMDDDPVMPSLLAFIRGRD